MNGWSKALRLFVGCALLTLLALTGCGTDAAPQPSGFGKRLGDRCGKTEDCASGLCVRLDSRGGLCSQVCVDDTGCPASDNWGCVAAAEQTFSVCACVPLSTSELCGDGLDNDCNGSVDDCRVCDGKRVANDDHEHCGNCETSCRADQTCSDAACHCASGKTDCGDACVDTQTDLENCGGCAKPCGPDQTCAAGQCACPASQGYCAGEGCFDLNEDAQHCGACDTACSDGQSCQGGHCVCPDAAAGDYCPGVGCVNLYTDAKYCGACDEACPSGQSCVSGECRCPADLTFCDGRCVDTDGDRNNCGECGTACPSSLTCIQGECSCSGASYAVCGSTCASLATDESNCGSCGHACAAGELCSSGECLCESQRHCDGACVPLDDDLNCGACGNRCPAGQSCSSDVCRCDGYGLAACGSDCLNLQNSEQSCGACDKTCHNGESCQSGDCRCPTGASYCAAADACVLLGTDEQNCGTCGKHCNPSEVCTGGTCACPLAGQQYCAALGKCVDTLSDAAHCGGCTTKCRATETCQSGLCGCPEYDQQYCSSQKACISVAANNQHCGACDEACPAATHCVYGGCQCDTAGQTLCGSVCYDLSKDADHCGTCDNDCGGNYQCVNGACQCPSPTVATSVRVTNDAVDEWGPAVAFNGTNVGVVYMQRTAVTAYVTNVRFALLKPDGTKVSDVALTNYTSSATTTAIFAPDLVWTGTEFGLVYVEYKNGYRTLFQRLNANGTSKGAAISVSGGAVVDSIYHGAAGLAWSPSYGGYAVAYGRPGNAGFALAFRRIGATGATLEAENLLDSTFAERTTTRVVVGPDGSWGVNAFGQFVLYNPDGSRTQPPLALPNASSLVYDGANWLATYVTDQNSPLYANRGVVKAATQIWPLTYPQYNGDTSAAMAGGSLAVLLSYRSDSSGPYELGLQRYLLPASASSLALTTPHSAIDVVPGTTLAEYGEAKNFSMAATSTTSLLVVWADGRWANEKEIYAAPVTWKSCP